MNKERALKLAEVLESGVLPLGVGFSMKDFLVRDGRTAIMSPVKLKDLVHTCDTTCCIGGLTCLLFEGNGHGCINGHRAQQLLELTDSQAGRLFFNDSNYVTQDKVDFYDVTPECAASAIRRMVAEESLV